MKDKKVLLIDPIYNSGNIPPNLGLGHIEAGLINYQLDLNLVDFVLPDSNQNMTLTKFNEKESEFLDRVSEQSLDADVVYITGSHGMEMKPYAIFPRIRDVANKVKISNPNAHVIFGGALANYYSRVLGIPADVFKEFGIDELVSGQESNATTKIIEKLNLKDSFKNSDLILPTWQSWELSKYPAYLSSMLVMGCPYACSFCFEGKVYDPKNPQALPKDIISMIDGLKDRHKFNGIMIEDSISLSYGWFDDLALKMSETEKNWAIYARSSEIVKNKDKLLNISAANCKSMVVGIESFEDELHQSTNKKITTSQTIQALELAKEANIAIQGCLILGFPEDNIKQIEKRIESAVNLDLSTYRWHLLQPDWKKPPETIMGLNGMSITDHFQAQVSMPDASLLEYIDQASPAVIYDEHVLMRLSPFYTDIKRLEQFGYNDQFNLREFMAAVAPLISKTGIPTNEDEMYPILFNPEFLKL